MLEGLNHPFGMLLLDAHLYVATIEAIRRHPFRSGETSVGPGERIAALPSEAPNEHWTRIDTRWQARLSDTRQVLTRAPWEGEFDPIDGFILHEASAGEMIKEG